MMIITNGQMDQFKIYAEANFKQKLFLQKQEQYNADIKISKEVFKNRILMNYATARYYGFNTKNEVEKFVDYTFRYRELNESAPLRDNIHLELTVDGRKADDKFKILSSILMSQYKD